MRFAVYAIKDGSEINIFKDGRSFKTKKWASTIALRHRRLRGGQFVIKKVPDIITDTDRIDWIERNGFGIARCAIGGFSVSVHGWGDIYPTARDAIDAAMKEIGE